jgi:hypothetical protein
LYGISIKILFLQQFLTKNFNFATTSGQKLIFYRFFKLQSKIDPKSSETLSSLFSNLSPLITNYNTRLTPCKTLILCTGNLANDARQCPNPRVTLRRAKDKNL